MTGWRKRMVMEMAREANLYMTSDERIAAVEAFAKLVREDCCHIVTGLCMSDNNAEEINKAIRERNNHD